MPQTVISQFYPADFPASPSAEQVNALAVKMIDGCGTTTQDSLENVSRIGLLLKIVQDSTAFQSGGGCKATWRQQVTRYGVSVFRLQVSGRRTSENERLLLPTPATSQLHKVIRKRIPSEIKGEHGKMLVGELGTIYPCLIGKYIHPEYVEWMMGFPACWTNPDCKLSATQLCRESFTRSLEQLEQSNWEKQNDN